MADTINDRVKKQKEEAERRKKAQADAGGSAPITPMGVAGQGATEDQAKMAGTPAAMATAADTGLPPVEQEQTTLGQAAQQQQEAAGIPQDESLQTELGEKSFDDQQRDAAQERAKAFSEKMETFGSLGQRVENMVTGAFSGATAEGELKNLAKDVGFELREEELATLTAPGGDPAEMAKLLSDFSDAGRTDPQAAFQMLVDNQSKFANPHSGIMDIVDRAYSKDPETMHKTVARLVADDIIDPDQVNFEHLIKSGFVNVDENGTIVELGVTKDELQDILGDNWQNLTPEQIGEEVEQKRDEVLANKEKIEEQLSDPDLPPQTRIALLDEMKRMGAIGAVEHEQRAVEAQQEAATSGQIIIGGEVQDVAELLQDENIKQDVVNFLADPESAENQEWARLNPEFADWLNRELESLNLTKETLEQNIGDFKGIQKHNEDFVASNLSSKGGRLKSELMNVLGYGDQAFELQNYGAGDDPVYNMLSGLSAGEQTSKAVAILNDLPPSQLGQLKGLPADKLKGLLTTPGKMEEFATMAKMKDKWQNLRNSNDASAMAQMILEGGNPGRGMRGAGEVKQRMAELYAQAKIGANPEVAAQYNLMRTLFDKDGNGHIDSPESVRAAIDDVLGKEGDLSSLVEGGLAGQISNFRNLGGAPNIGGIYQHMKNVGAIGDGDTSISNEDVDKISGGTDIHTLGQLLNVPGLGINKNHVVGRMRGKANENVESKITGAKLNWEHFKDNSHTLTRDTEVQNNFKKAVQELKNMGGHGFEREAANKRLGEMMKSITAYEPLEWSDVMRVSRDMSKIGSPGKAPESIKHLVNQGPKGWAFKTIKGPDGYNPGVQEFVHRYATWQAFTDNKNDLNAFMRNIDGKL
jgi:hypothetical protein